jgi:ribosome-associated protein
MIAEWRFMQTEDQGVEKRVMAVAKKMVKSMLDGRTKALLCAQQALEYRAQEVILLDVRGLTSFADYFVIGSARSTRQAQGIADHLEQGLREHGVKPLGVEGRREGHWILMDYGDVVVHIFHETTRRFYDLESLWSEAEKVLVEGSMPSVAPPAEDPY